MAAKLSHVSSVGSWEFTPVNNYFYYFQTIKRIIAMLSTRENKWGERYN